jgi:hypothetical protein
MLPPSLIAPFALQDSGEGPRIPRINNERAVKDVKNPTSKSAVPGRCGFKPCGINAAKICLRSW